MSPDVSPEVMMGALGGTTIRPPMMFGKVRVHSMADIGDAAPRGYVVKGLMSPGEMSVWWGPPKCGKSFLLLHIAYAIAQGRTVFGRRVKACPVLYVAAEGEAGLAGRLRAIRDAMGPAPLLHLIAQPVDLFRKDGDLESVKAAAMDKRIGARVIFLDTLARVMAGGDENAPQDMGALITNIGVLRSCTSAHVAVVHHGTKNPNGGTPRGHGSLIGAADLVVEVAKGVNGTRSATVTAAKDDPDGAAMAFALGVVDMGTDADGDPITTCIVHEADATPIGTQKPKEARLRDQPALMLRELRTLMLSSGAPASPIPGGPLVITVTRLMLRKRLIDRGWFAENLLSTTSDGNPKPTDAGYGTENKALTTLKRNSFLAYDRDLVWLI